MAHRINMKDIAREAGVSVATVSYIINKRSDQSIAPDTVARVNEAIKKLGYVPNLGARALANRKTRLIGLVIPQAETGSRMMLENSFYGEFIAVLEEVLRQSGYSLLLSGEDVNKSYVELARERALDGIVVVGLPADQDARLLLEENIPLVFVDSYLEGNAYSSVNIQDEEGGYLACDYLIKNGHRNIAFVSGFLTLTFDDRAACASTAVEPSLLQKLGAPRRQIDRALFALEKLWGDAKPVDLSAWVTE